MSELPNATQTLLGDTLDLTKWKYRLKYDHSCHFVRLRYPLNLTKWKQKPFLTSFFHFVTHVSYIRIPRRSSNLTKWKRRPYFVPIGHFVRLGPHPKLTK